jgi:predicted XRE-type DNA-binding protein
MLRKPLPPRKPRPLQPRNYPRLLQKADALNRTVSKAADFRICRVQRRMTLAELRTGRKISQATVAEALGIGQMQISRLKKRKNPRLSTMARTVAAMGGHLTMIATFPDQEPVVLIPSQLFNGATRRAKRA